MKRDWSTQKYSGQNEEKLPMNFLLIMFYCRCNGYQTEIKCPEEGNLILEFYLNMVVFASALLGGGGKSEFSERPLVFLSLFDDDVI